VPGGGNFWTDGKSIPFRDTRELKALIERRTEPLRAFGLAAKDDDDSPHQVRRVHFEHEQHSGTKEQDQD